MHAPWAMAIAARLREALGIEAQSIWSDDGIALHFPESDVPPPIDELMIDPGEVEDLVVAEVGETALFGARFRENAGRSLLIPRRRPGERTPLWQQRLKAQSLLQVARKYGSFPVILETYRECLQDVFDLPALRGLLQALKTREIDLVEVETQSASPYSTSLLFDYIATYMYEDDTPPAERRAQALSLDRDLLRELLGQEELRDLLDADAVEEVERQLQGDPKTPDQLHDKLRLRGDLRQGEYDPALAEPLLAERRAVIVRIAGEERLIAVEDAGRYRDALGAMPPSGLPDAFLEGGPESLRQLVLRFAKGRGPFTTRDADERFGRDVGGILAELEADEQLVRGELRPGGTEREWCDPDVLRRLRRASLAALRREVEPSTRRRSRGSCPSWHGVDRRASLREALVPLQALPLPVALWESEVLPRRVPGYPARAPRRARRRAARSSGSAPARTASRSTSARTRRVLGQVAGTPRPEGPEHDAIRAALRSALFWDELLAETQLDEAIALPALWDLVWSGEVTNDAWTPLRASRRFGAPKAGAPSAPFLAPPRAGDDRDRRTLVAHRPPLRRLRPTGARSPSCCSSGRASSRATACAPRASPAATAPSTRSCVRSRRSGSAGAATSSRVSAARSSRSAARSSGCASCASGQRTATRSSSPPPTRRSPTAPRCRGRSAPARAPRGSPARSSSRSAASRCSTSSAAAARSCRCAIPHEAWLRPALDALVAHVRAGRRQAARGRALRRRAGRRERARCRCSSRRASSPGRAARCYGRSSATTSAAGHALAPVAKRVPAQRLIRSASPAARAAARSGAVR